MIWNPGDRLKHRFNPDLGSGRVVEIDGRTLLVWFAKAETTLRLALDDSFHQAVEAIMRGSSDQPARS